MTRTSSNRSSRRVALLFAAVLVAAVGATAVVAAVELAQPTVQEEDVPDAVTVGEQRTFELRVQRLYDDYEQWTLRGETALENVSWTVVYYDTETDTKVDQVSRNGQTFVDVPVNADANQRYDQLRIRVTGTVPPVTEHTWPEREMFTVAALTQAKQGGTSRAIGQATAHHYTSESRAARQALADARAAIDDASSAGAGVSDAQTAFENAVRFYESSDFQAAVTNADRAAEKATDAKQSKQESEQTTTMLLVGGGVLALVVVVGAGVYWYRSQQDDYDKLG